VHYCKDKKLCKSYAEVAKAPGFLSGANKIPLGNLDAGFNHVLLCIKGIRFSRELNGLRLA
jgi:hypothetical protein